VQASKTEMHIIEDSVDISQQIKVFEGAYKVVALTKEDVLQIS
jgi:hypothetical protein